MRSLAWRHWCRERVSGLDELEAAHAHVRHAGSRRTLQLVHGYAVLLASHFQGFCRSLHDEAVDHVVGPLAPRLRSLVREQFFVSRKLDTGNANPGNIGADFGRLGLELWPAAAAIDRRTAARRGRLEELNAWRNAVAHQQFKGPMVARARPLRLSDVRRWRSACVALAWTFDEAVRRWLTTLVGVAPW